MDQTEYKNIQTLSQFTTAQFLKKLTQLLLSVSVFSFLFAHSPLLSFLHSSNFHFSTFPFQLFSHTIDKNCMFLLCNGLVVFLAKYSGFISSSSKYNRSIELLKNYEDDTPSFMVETKVPLLEKEVVVESVEPLQYVDVKEDSENKYIIEESLKRETEKLIVEEEAQEEEHWVLFTNEKEEEEEEEYDIFVVECEEVKTESDMFNEEVEVEELSSEELNKKFDDFIRKRKEELRIENQQQIVMV